jgi:alpha-glucoside transport system permease protein
MQQVLSALFTVIVGIAAAMLYFWGANRILDLLFPQRAADGRAARNQKIAATVRPWLFLGPALVALCLYLVYPVVESLRLSVFDRAGESFAGLSNYRWALTDREFRQAIFNNLLWLGVVPATTTFLGLVIAFLTDRIWWGNIAKSLIFMPLAISFVGASVIWKFIYDYRSEGSTQIGLLNAIVQGLGGEPQAWITIPFWNNFFLMLILIWIQTGFAMVILSAALRSISEETIEAAIIDGAKGWQLLFHIVVPQIWGTIAVVWTTITILVLKVFDIVLAMTNGQWNTQVMANLMFDWMFRGGGDFGRGATIAIVIMLAVVPIMVWNIRRAAGEIRGR